MIAQRRELAVFRAEIVAPFADAMRFVNGDEADVPALQVLQHPGEHQAFGGGIKQLVLAVVEAAQALSAFALGPGGVSEGGGDPGGVQSIHLVLHVGDERRDHHREARFDQRGELEAERFAAPGGEQGKDVKSVERIENDLLLQRAKRWEAERLLQRCQELTLHVVNGHETGLDIDLRSRVMRQSEKLEDDANFHRSKKLRGRRFLPQALPPPTPCECGCNGVSRDG